MRKIAVAAIGCSLILHIVSVTHGKPLANGLHDSEAGQSNLRQVLDQAASILYVSEDGDDDSGDVDGATETKNTTDTSNLEKFFVTLHTTVERAKPFVLKLEQSTKGLIGQIGSLVDRATDVIGTFLIGDSFNKDGEEGEVNTSSSPETTAAITTTSSTVVEASSSAAMEGVWLNLAENEIGDDTLCPDGFAANVNRICQRVMGYDGEALK